MPGYHHGVELQTLIARGLTVRCYRVDERMRMDLDDVRAKLRPSTRALYVTHFLGYPQPIGEAKRIAENAGIPLIEDCALSLFSAAEDGGPLGRVGDFSIFCLYKSLPVPQGGAIAVNRADLALPPEPREPDPISTSSYVLNRLLDELMTSGIPASWRMAHVARAIARVAKRATGATIVPIDTEEFDPAMMDVGTREITRRIVRYTDAASMVATRRANFLLLEERLDSAVRRVLPPLPDGACPLSFPIFVRDKEEAERRFRDRGIETINMWSRHHPASPAGSFPEVDFLRRHVLELPIHQGLRASHVDYVARAASTIAKW
jgi:dTDP-4-amino-4,6-dideoxygalactose transaminase